MTTQAQSVFEDDERSTYSHPFKKFYTTGEPVVFKTQNRFEGRSNYLNYYPTDDLTEQKLEKFWHQNQNRLLMDKRRNEELQQTMKEWSDARARMEMEIQRKKEHLNEGTNFAEARGFVRKNWKTKNFNYENNPLLEESSTDTEDYGEEIYDDVDPNQSFIPGTQNIEEKQDEEDGSNDEEERADPDESPDDKRSKSLPKNRPRQLSGTSRTLPVHDLTKDPIGYGIRPSTAVQVKQMEFITNFNKALPKRKQNQAIPMIHSTNVGVLQSLKKDQKKKTTEIVTKFTPIGMVDDF
jgi:hypothetical protein